MNEDVLQVVAAMGGSLLALLVLLPLFWFCVIKPRLTRAVISALRDAERRGALP